MQLMLLNSKEYLTKNKSSFQIFWIHILSATAAKNFVQIYCHFTEIWQQEKGMPFYWNPVYNVLLLYTVTYKSVCTTIYLQSQKQILGLTIPESQIPELKKQSKNCNSQTHQCRYWKWETIRHDRLRKVIKMQPLLNLCVKILTIAAAFFKKCPLSIAVADSK